MRRPLENCGGQGPACAGPQPEPAEVAQLRIIPPSFSTSEYANVPVEVLGRGTLRAYGLELAPTTSIEVVEFERSEATARWFGHDHGRPSENLFVGGFDPEGVELSMNHWTTLGTIVVRMGRGSLGVVGFELVNATDDLEDVPYLQQTVGASGLAGSEEFSARVTPNPSSCAVQISYSIPGTTPTLVKMGIYNIQCRLVKDLADEIRAPGEHELTWSGEDSEGRRVAAGTYFYRVEAGSFSETHKIVRTR